MMIVSGVAVGKSGTRVGARVGVGFAAGLPLMMPGPCLGAAGQTGTWSDAPTALGTRPTGNRRDTKATIIMRGMVHGDIGLPPLSWSLAPPQRTPLDPLVSPCEHLGILLRRQFAARVLVVPARTQRSHRLSRYPRSRKHMAATVRAW